MFLRILIGSLLAAVASFMWGMVWWTITPFPLWVVKELPNRDSTAQEIAAKTPETGIYFYPWRAPKEGEDRFAVDKELSETRVKGPFLVLIVRKEGVPQGPELFGAGFAHGFVAALLAALLLAMNAGSLTTYLSRVGFVFLLGVFVALVSYGSDLIWFHHPWQWPAFSAGFTVSNWLIAGIILGAIVRRPASPPVPVLI